jgi:hypothetical protein
MPVAYHNLQPSGSLSFRLVTFPPLRLGLAGEPFATLSLNFVCVCVYHLTPRSYS